MKEMGDEKANQFYCLRGWPPPPIYREEREAKRYVQHLFNLFLLVRNLVLMMFIIILNAKKKKRCVLN